MTEHLYSIEGIEDRDGDIFYTLSVWQENKPIEFEHSSYDYCECEEKLNKLYPYAEHV